MMFDPQNGFGWPLPHEPTYGLSAFTIRELGLVRHEMPPDPFQYQAPPGGEHQDYGLHPLRDPNNLEASAYRFDNPYASSGHEDSSQEHEAHAGPEEPSGLETLLHASEAPSPQPTAPYEVPPSSFDAGSVQPEAPSHDDVFQDHPWFQQEMPFDPLQACNFLHQPISDATPADVGFAFAKAQAFSELGWPLPENRAEGFCCQDCATERRVDPTLLTNGDQPKEWCTACDDCGRPIFVESIPW